MRRMINAFSPSEKDIEEIIKIVEEKKYKYVCWLPESIMCIGDSYIFFDDLEKDFTKSDWVGRAINNNPQWIKTVEEEFNDVSVLLQRCSKKCSDNDKRTEEEKRSI